LNRDNIIDPAEVLDRIDKAGIDWSSGYLDNRDLAPAGGGRRGLQRYRLSVVGGVSRSPAHDSRVPQHRFLRCPRQQNQH
jgi:hypothetical protein